MNTINIQLLEAARKAESFINGYFVPKDAEAQEAVKEMLVYIRRAIDEAESLVANANVIRINLIDGVWYATYSGEHAAMIKALFGTDTIPTCYTAGAPSGVVVGLLQQKNPDALVLIN